MIFFSEKLLRLLALIGIDKAFELINAVRGLLLIHSYTECLSSTPAP